MYKTPKNYRSSRRSTKSFRIRKYRKRNFSSYNAKVPRILFTPNRSSTGMPSTLKTKFIYNDTINLSGTTAADVTYIYRGNSLYDPDFTGTGHQPLNYDQMCLFYNRYTVFASKIEVTFHVGDQNPKVAFVVATASTSTLTYANLRSQSNCRVRDLGVLGSSKDVGFIKNYDSFGRVFGIATQTDSNSAAVNANPSEVWYWIVGVNSLIGGASAVETICRVKITYYANMTSKANLSES